MLAQQGAPILSEEGRQEAIYRPAREKAAAIATNLGEALPGEEAAVLRYLSQMKDYTVADVIDTLAEYEQDSTQFSKPQALALSRKALEIVPE